MDRNEPNNQLLVESNNNFYATKPNGDGNLESFCDDEESSEYNLIVNEPVQFNTQLNTTNLQQFFDYQTGQLQNIPTNNPREETYHNTSKNNSQEKRRQSRLTPSEKRFICEYCNKEFKLKHHLTR